MCCPWPSNIYFCALSECCEFFIHFTNNFSSERKSSTATLPYQVTKCLKFISYNADSCISNISYRVHLSGRGYQHRHPSTVYPTSTCFVLHGLPLRSWIHGIGFMNDGVQRCCADTTTDVSVGIIWSQICRGISAITQSFWLGWGEGKVM
jgi:hypothetical protein